MNRMDTEYTGSNPKTWSPGNQIITGLVLYLANPVRSQFGRVVDYKTTAMILKRPLLSGPT